MKKTLTMMALLAGAVAGYSQGTILMNDYNGSFGIQIFGPQSLAASSNSVSYGGFTGSEEMGDTANANIFPTPGTTVYAAANPLGAGFSVQLLAAPGVTTLANLLPVSAANEGVVTTWYTTGVGAGAGFWSTGNVPTIPGATGTATIAIAAWETSYGSLAAAQASGASGVWGISEKEK